MTYFDITARRHSLDMAFLAGSRRGRVNNINIGIYSPGMSQAKKWGETRYFLCFGNKNQRYWVWISICFYATAVTAFRADSVARCDIECVEECAK